MGMGNLWLIMGGAFVYCILYIAWLTGNDPANEETPNST